MVANDDDHAPLARRAAALLRVHSQGIVMLSPPLSSRERKEAIEAIAQALRQRRRYAFARGVGALAVLVIAASAAAVLFAR